MKTLSKAVAIASLVSAGAMTSAISHAEVSYNAAVVTDYVWRGFSQNDNGFAVQGGADYEHESGLSVGAWASTIMLDAEDGEDTFEVDVYASYGFQAGGMDLSAGFITYNYDESDMGKEINFGASKDAFSAMVSIAVDTETDAGYTYLEAAYDMALPQDLDLSLHAGYNILETDFVDDVLDLSATVGKSLEMVDVSATVTYTNADELLTEDDVLFFLSASKEF